MRRHTSEWMLTLFSLGTIAVLLTGCPKGTVPPGAALGGASGQGEGSNTGPAAAAEAGTGAASGTGASAAGTTGAGANVAAAGRVMLPDLPSPREFIEAPGLSDIHFEYDQFVVRVQDRMTLDVNARWLTDHPGALILIEGHADERGTDEYNLALGERRAQSTRDQLVVRGVPLSRIRVITYGEERPLCAAHAESCWARNRRAHFLVKA